MNKSKGKKGGQKLNARQELFCKEYIKDLNSTQAAIRAGYSKKTARSIASINLTKQNIVERIQELTRDRNKKLEIDAEWVLNEAVNMFKRIKDEDPKTAKGYLELIGKHIDVSAFEERMKLGGEVQITQIERKII